MHPPHHNLIHVFSLTVRADSFLLFFFFFLHSFSLNLFFFTAFADSWQLRTICHRHKSQNQSFQHPTQRGTGWFLTITRKRCHLGRLIPSQAGFLAITFPQKIFSWKVMLVEKYFPAKIGKIPLCGWQQKSRWVWDKDRDAQTLHPWHGWWGVMRGFPLIPEFGMELGWSQAGPAPRAWQSFTSHLAEQNF